MQDCDPKLYMYTASGRMDAQNARPDIVSTVAAKQAARGKGTQDGVLQPHPAILTFKNNKLEII